MVMCMRVILYLPVVQTTAEKNKDTRSSIDIKTTYIFFLLMVRSGARITIT